MFQSPCGDWICGNLESNADAIIQACFSPLAGIRYAETNLNLNIDVLKTSGFSPLAGIRYAETKVYFNFFSYEDSSFSPLAGIRYAETEGNSGINYENVKFQSPCGD